MPTYVYKFIDTDETIEVQQSFTDATLTEYAHPETGESMPVKKVFLPVGVTFKGDGFYKTDSRSSTKKSAASTGDTGSSDSSSKSDSSTSDSSAKSDSSSSSTKAPSTAASSSSSTSGD
jgi:predicted nucleic acid-binding Zn ribbon protein